MVNEVSFENDGKGWEGRKEIERERNPREIDDASVRSWKWVN